MNVNNEKTHQSENWALDKCRWASCNKIFSTTKKLVKKTYPERAHWALLKFLCQNFRNRNEEDNHICEVCESNCFECSTKDEVENDKENSVVNKADLIINKDMDTEIWSPQYER